MAGSGFEDRIALVAGDAMHQIPAGAGAYILKHMLHGCSDSECHTMLKQCRDALAGSSARLLVIEQVLLPGKQSALGKFLDLQMMLQQQGRERYEKEFRDLFQRAGLALTRIIPTASSESIREVSCLGAAGSL